MNRIYKTTLRLNLDDEDERRAYEYLRRIDKKEFHSCSKLISAAINEFFERQEQLAADPYLETREKEDAFLERVAKTIENSLKTVPVVVQSAIPTETATVYNEELSAALDFADSF